MRNDNGTTRLSRMTRRYLSPLLIFLLLSSTCTASTTTTASYSGQCFPEQTSAGSVYACTDNSEYRTHMGLPCSFHAKIISLSTNGENCFNEWLAGTSQGATWLAKTYDQNQIFELVWECPCSCNVKCFDSDDEPTASPTRTPSMQDNGSAVGGVGLSDKEFHGSGGSESVRNQSDGEEQPINSRVEDNEADETASTVVVAPAVSDSSPDTPPDNSGGNESLQFVAMIAGAVVGGAVLCVSVLSLIQNVRKKRGQIGSNAVVSAPTQHRGDLVSGLSDISVVSMTSDAESLNSEEKIRLYKAWKLAVINRKGVEDGFDVVEP